MVSASRCGGKKYSHISVSIIEQMSCKIVTLDIGKKIQCCASRHALEKQLCEAVRMLTSAKGLNPEFFS